jgi:NAD(P)-dependent dehydrogenase (short-subunit alcohol dehydrogenase family)
MDLAGRTAIVTGSGRGIGRALAVEFARQGANVVICARRKDDLAETAAIIEKGGGSVLSIPTDVAKKAQVDRLVQETLKAFGRIDVLFNNAASFRALGAVWEVDPETWWRDVTTNDLGPFLCARAVLPHMMKRNEGVIVNMNGGGALSFLTGGSGYGCSKAFLLRFTETLSKELEKAASNVIVVAIGPGFVHTETTELQRIDPMGVKWIPSSKELLDAGKSRPPEDCAKATVWMLRNISKEMSGRVFEVDTDFDDIARRAADIKAKDIYVMRLRKDA